MHYVDTLKHLHKGDKVANRKQLDPNYPTIFTDFIKALLKKCREQYGTTGPKKVHIIETHGMDYFNKHKSTFHGKTDQNMESTHQKIT